MKKVVLISGGSDGIGRAAATRLRERYTVFILSNDGPKCLRVASELGISCVVGDVSDYDAMKRAVATVTERHGRLDIIINNAGIWLEGRLETNDPDRIKRTLEVNTLGTINLTHAALPALKAQKGSRIINVISQAGLVAKAERSVYAASKWAITGFTKALQAELAPDGITVAGIYPGKINTQLFEKAGNHKSMGNALKVDDVARTIELAVDAPDGVQFTEIGMTHI